MMTTDQRMGLILSTKRRFPALKFAMQYPPSTQAINLETFVSTPPPPGLLDCIRTLQDSESLKEKTLVIPWTW